MKRLINGTVVRSLVIAFIIAVGAVASLPAGGQKESTTPAAEVQSSPEAVRSEAADDSLATIQRALEEIGIRTFRGSIASVDFSLEALDGGTVRLSDHRGEFIFLNFWATWCPPCREEMPSMERLQAEMVGQPFRILAVNVQEDRSTVASFVDENGYTFPILLDRSGQVAGNYSVRGIPTSYFIAPDGTMLGMLVGTRYWDETEVFEALETAIAAAE